MQVVFKIEILLNEMLSEGLSEPEKGISVLNIP